MFDTTGLCWIDIPRTPHSDRIVGAEIGGWRAVQKSQISS